MIIPIGLIVQLFRALHRDATDARDIDPEKLAEQQGIAETNRRIQPVIQDMEGKGAPLGIVETVDYRKKPFRPREAKESYGDEKIHR